MLDRSGSIQDRSIDELVFDPIEQWGWLAMLSIGLLQSQLLGGSEGIEPILLALGLEVIILAVAAVLIKRLFLLIRRQVRHCCIILGHLGRLKDGHLRDHLGSLSRCQTLDRSARNRCCTPLFCSGDRNSCSVLGSTLFGARRSHTITGRRCATLRTTTLCRRCLRRHDILFGWCILRKINRFAFDHLSRGSKFLGFIYQRVPKLSTSDNGP